MKKNIFHRLLEIYMGSRSPLLICMLCCKSYAIPDSIKARLDIWRRRYGKRTIDDERLMIIFVAIAVFC